MKTRTNKKMDGLTGLVKDVNNTVRELERKVQSRTILNNRRKDFLAGFVFYGSDPTLPPEVSVVDAVQLILDHLGLEIVENEKLSLVKKEEE